MWAGRNMKVLAALVESIIVAHHGRPMLSYVGIKIIKHFFGKRIVMLT